MLKKAFLFFLITLLSSSLNSCFMPPEVMFEQVIEYNPQKAGAKITKRINLPKKYGYIDCINSQLYWVTVNNVYIFDLTCDESDDKMDIIKSIPFNIHTLYTDTTSDKYGVQSILGVVDFDNTITLFLSIRKYVYNKQGSVIKSSILKDKFTLDYDGNLSYSDLTVDILDEWKNKYVQYNDAWYIKNAHYDDNNKCLYVVTLCNDNYVNIFSKYVEKNYCFEIDETVKIPIDTITNFTFYTSDSPLFCVRSRIDRDFGTESIIQLRIYPSYQSNTYKEVDLTYLDLRTEPLSVFYYKDHCWLYVTTDILIDGKHSSRCELWEIELL